MVSRGYQTFPPCPFILFPLPGMPVLMPVRMTIYLTQTKVLLRVKENAYARTIGINQLCPGQTKAHYHLSQLYTFVPSLLSPTTCFQIFPKKFHSLFPHMHIGGPFMGPAQLSLIGCLGPLISSSSLDMDFSKSEPRSRCSVLKRCFKNAHKMEEILLTKSQR